VRAIEPSAVIDDGVVAGDHARLLDAQGLGEQCGISRHECVVRERGWVAKRAVCAGRQTSGSRHCRKRECKPWEGMMLHQDGSRLAELGGAVSNCHREDP
jgi:hypothetical protein